MTVQADPSRRRWPLPGLPVLVLACVALAALSLALPSAPDKDPWSWIIWGREVAHLSLDTAAGSSWKPLPVLFTTVFSPFGHAAPDLWLVVARAGGLLAVLFAYRIGVRLAGRVAGVVAAICLLAADWTRYLGNGHIEPLCAGLALGAIDRHLEGHRHQAVLLGALAALGRVELWPFVALYVIWLFFREGTRRLVVVGLLLAVPALWLGGDWWGSGDPFHGSSRAAGFQSRSLVRQKTANKPGGVTKAPTPPSAKESLSNTASSAADLEILPVFVAALVGLAYSIRRRERTALAMAIAAGGLFVVVAVMAVRGYGGSPRFLFPTVGVVSVLAGVGVASLLRATGRRAWSVALAAVLAAATIPFAVTRVRTDEKSLRVAGLRARAQEGLDRIIQEVGPSRVRAAGNPNAPSQLKDQLAWELGVRLRDVGKTKLPAAVFIYRGPRSSAVGTQPPTPAQGDRVRLLASAGDWTALAVTQGDGSPRPRP
jgi:hypothetical protein